MRRLDLVANGVLRWLSAQHTSLSSFLPSSTRSPRSRPIVRPNTSSSNSKQTLDSAESKRPLDISSRIKAWLACVSAPYQHRSQTKMKVVYL